MKKILIALLGIISLLVALLTAQAAQPKVKTYDALKLAEYSACLLSISYSDRGSIEWQLNDPRVYCSRYKP